MAEEHIDEAVVEEGQTESTTEETSAPKNDNKKLYLSLFVVAVLIIGALQLTGSISLLGSPAVATVNGEKISQAEFDERVTQIFASQEAQLVDLDDPALRASIERQILDEIINTRLLLQKAEEGGFSATDAEVETEYQLIMNRLGTETSTPEERAAVLAEELAKNGLTDADFRDNIRDQIVIEKYLDSQIDTSALTVTEDEIALFYDQYAAIQADAPPLEDIAEEIEAQLISQKRQQAVGDHILTLRNEADVVIVE